eukprot:m.35376 g.35376  ORF g.35376 m.35376 type:complete len:346 (+) comp6599_c0_seq2:52-1089(+)
MADKVTQTRVPPKRQLVFPSPVDKRHTGYTANFRPVITYDSKNEADPTLKHLCSPQLQYTTRTARDYHHRHRNLHFHDHTERHMKPKSHGSGGEEMSRSWTSSTTMGMSYRPPVKRSGFQRSLSLTTPRSKETAEWRSLHSKTTEARISFKTKTLVSSHAVSSSGQKKIHQFRQSAFTQNFQGNNIILAQHSIPMNKFRSESKKKFANGEFIETNLHEIPSVSRSDTQFVWGTRSRPYYLPPTARQTYGEATQPSSATMAHLKKTHPAEFSNMQTVRLNKTWTHHNHGNMHSVAQEEKRKLMNDNRAILAKPKTSGFVINVDTFKQKRRDDSNIYVSTTQLSFTI